MLCGCPLGSPNLHSSSVKFGNSPTTSQGSKPGDHVASFHLPFHTGCGRPLHELEGCDPLRLNSNALWFKVVSRVSKKFGNHCLHEETWEKLSNNSSHPKSSFFYTLNYFLYSFPLGTGEWKQTVQSLMTWAGMYASESPQDIPSVEGTSIKICMTD